MNIGWGTTALLTGAVGTGVGVGLTVLNQPKEDVLGHSNGYISGREIAGAGIAALGTSAVIAGMAGLGANSGIAARRFGGAALGLTAATALTGIAFGASSTDSGVTFDSVAYDLVDRYDYNKDGKLEGTLQPTLVPGNESTRTDGSRYLSIDRLMSAIDNSGTDGEITAEPEDIIKVVQGYDANGDGRLQEVEQKSFDSDFGERYKSFGN